MGLRLPISGKWVCALIISEIYPMDSESLNGNFQTITTCPRNIRFDHLSDTKALLSMLHVGLDIEIA